MPKIRDRIMGLRRIKASELRPNAKNWRTHPEGQQNALRGILAEVGWAQALVARELPDGTYELIDGHLRQDVAGDSEVPVLVLDVTDAEADKLLASLDPLAAMAEMDKEALQMLLGSVETQNDALQAMFAGLLAQDVKSGGGGWRTGEAWRPEQGVAEWKNAETFFSCPDEIRAELEKRENFVVEFSGGKDSLSALTWLRTVFPDRHVFAVYIDTGVEFPGLGCYVTEVCEHLGAEPVILKPELEWWSWLRKSGEWPSMLYRPCMQQFIHGPWAKWVRAKFDPNTVAVFTGSRAEEASRGSKKTATSPLDSLGADQEKIFHFAPCFDAKKPVLEEMLAAMHVPLWEGYSRGFVRTACWCCMGQRGEQACALVDNYPGLAEDIRRWEKKIGPLQPLSKEGGKCFDEIVAAGRKRLAKAAEQAAANTNLPG